jgi:hypothetical protein
LLATNVAAIRELLFIPTKFDLYFSLIHYGIRSLYVLQSALVKLNDFSHFSNTQQCVIIWTSCIQFYYIATIVITNSYVLSASLVCYDVMHYNRRILKKHRWELSVLSVVEFYNIANDVKYQYKSSLQSLWLIFFFITTENWLIECSFYLLLSWKNQFRSVFGVNSLSMWDIN